MNASVNNRVNQENILAILNNNVIKEESRKEAMIAMGLSSCQVACMSYKCCTGHGSGGKHSRHSYKIKH
ncbi:MAG: hypothetical protein IJE18_08615 [Bacteroidaceae bacterium]|nr:hypothetical protein [Bacteroidaceae bacterium]